MTVCIGAVQILTCAGCKHVIGSATLSDFESPKTVFDYIISRFPPGTKLRICYDNGCNLLHYILNREPERAKDIEVYIDALHSAGHKQCLRAYSTSALPLCVWVRLQAANTMSCKQCD